MPTFPALPQEIRDLIYCSLIPSNSFLLLPESTSRVVSCPALFLVSRQFYTDSRKALYSTATIVFTPKRSALAELSRRPIRRQISKIAINLPYWTCSRGVEVCDLSDELMAKIVKLFRHLSSITLRLLMHATRSMPAPSKQSLFYPSFLKNRSWNFMITKVCLDMHAGNSTPFSSDTGAKDPLSHLKKLPNLRELELRIRTSSTGHSTYRSPTANNAHTMGDAHRRLRNLLTSQISWDIYHCLLGAAPLFPDVEAFQLWHVFQYRNHIHFDAIQNREILDLFGGRAVEPELLKTKPASCQDHGYT